MQNFSLNRYLFLIFLSLINLFFGFKINAAAINNFDSDSENSQEFEEEAPSVFELIDQDDLTIAGKYIAKAKRLSLFFDYINDRDVDGATPLHWTAWRNMPEFMDLLLKNNADPNLVEDQDGCTPLHWAVDQNHLEAVEKLLNAKGVKNNLTDMNNYTPFLMALLHLYINNDQPESISIAKKIVFLFLKKGFIINSYADQISAMGYDVALIENLNSIYIYKNRLKQAILSGDYAKVKYFATKCSFGLFDELGETPLYWAIRSRKLDMLALVLFIRPELTENLDYNFIYFLIANNYFEAIKALCKYKDLYESEIKKSDQV